MDGAVLGIVRDFEQRRDRARARRPAVRARAPPRRDVRAPERAPAGSRRARRRSLPRDRDRRGASRSRPIRRAVGRTAKARRPYRHRARPHSRFRPPPIDPFPRAATRAPRACESRGRPSRAFRARASASPYRPVAWQQRRPLGIDLVASDSRPRALDRAARLLPRTDGNAPRAARGCRARFPHRATNATASVATDSARSWSAMRPSRSPRTNRSFDSASQLFERRTVGTANLQAIDRRRKIRDGDSPARIASGVDHHDAFLRPVSSAG